MIAPILPLTRDQVGQCRSSAERERVRDAVHVASSSERERESEDAPVEESNKASQPANLTCT